ncbi:hypothetical protein APICC_05499 [Apis cerana cerana]|uniref:Uncharacterized protein n=1 Tax=Apis cerana cerana TaxID=94128 RepID=A0A2A3ELH9_APICC|nr:hypothetical protein APICC_05499 [Apis cerana cerana]
MCDLIDLNSPDIKGSLSSKLASPLIPVPTDICKNFNTRKNEPNSPIIGKRDSLENNPFDMVLHKTTEYIQKKDDPFEMTLEKAMKLKCKQKSSLRSSSLDLPDNSIVKQKVYTQKLKMNQTADELSINKLNTNNVITNKVSNENIIVNVSNTNMLCNNSKSDVPIIEIQDNDLSILNQSEMNDILFETDNKSNKNQIKSILQNKMSLHMQKDKISMEQIPFSNVTLKVPKFRRSFSQGEAVSSKESQYLHQVSLFESLGIDSDNNINVYSSNSLDLLNEGFLKSYSNESSISNLSNISSIPKLNSVSSTINSSIMLSNGTMNRTFLESCSSEKSQNTKLSENMDLNKEVKSIFPIEKDLITSVANTSIKTSISDLTDRFNKLKAKISETHIESYMNNKDEFTYNSSNIMKECITVMEKSEKYDMNNKLIDVDVFTPDNNKEYCKNSISDTSSDSVFFEENKINKSIRQEAKLLARTFEELALKTSSGSSMDDFITNNSLWTLELLPAFDDETSVENLIELPTSPEGTDTKSKNIEIAENKCNDSNKSKKNEFSNNVKVKDLEMELVEPILIEKRFTAVTLLLELKKLIETENNVEASKLVKNLEKALGINCENNTELLTTYLNATNNLAKNPEKSSNNLDMIKNVAEHSMEYSQENNLTNNSMENIKESEFFEKTSFNASKCIDNQKYLNNVNYKSKCETPETKICIEKIKKEKDENEIISHNNEDSYKQENNLINEKMVIELLANIGKLLCEQTDEHPTLNVLKNLGKVLNFTSNNCNVDKNTKSNNAYIEIQQTPKKSKLKFENESRSLYSNSTNRLSLSLESKKISNKNFIRRSISVSQTPPFKNESNLSMFNSKSTSQLKEITKRFSSDPSFIKPESNKEIITNNDKNILQKDLQKEKSTISTVRNKFKKKINTNITNKKGPMKAILPIGNMQKRETINKKLTSSIGTTTPPQSHKIISSTPNSTNNELLAKKSRSAKPVASSTPDAQNSKIQKAQSQIINSPKKRNFSCDISPVTTRININNCNGMSNNLQRNTKLPSPKKTTPKRRTTESNIPKIQTPPINKSLNSSFEINQYERLYESPKRSIYKQSNSQKNSPISFKNNGNNIQRSPLRDNNKIVQKVKPINLISKLRRYSNSNIVDKENSYV